MIKITSSLFLATLLGLCLHVAAAQAQLVRTCVSMAKGNDANAASSCHCTTPCRTFATAHANTLSDGEITVLDPGDYGGLTITKSISINNDSGGEASITVSGGTTGIIVNAGSGAYVNLRGLTIQGVGFGTTTGLRFNTGLFLTMTNCVVRNHTGNAIEFRPNGNSNLSVLNTLAADNGGSGLFVQPTGSGAVKVALSRVEAHNNSAHGVFVDGGQTTGTINAAVSESVAAGNSQVGFLVASDLSHTFIKFMLVRSVAANNGTGLQNGGHAEFSVGESVVTGNLTSWPGCVASYGDNFVRSNGDGDPPAGCGATKK